MEVKLERTTAPSEVVRIKKGCKNVQSDIMHLKVGGTYLKLGLCVRWIQRRHHTSINPETKECNRELETIRQCERDGLSMLQIQCRGDTRGKVGDVLGEVSIREGDVSRRGDQGQ